MLGMPFSMAYLKKRSICFSLLATLILIQLMFVNFINCFMVSNRLLKPGLRDSPLNFYTWVFKKLQLQILHFSFSNKASCWCIYLSIWVTLFLLATTLAFSISLSSNSVRLLNLKILEIFTTFWDFRSQELPRVSS